MTAAGGCAEASPGAMGSRRRSCSPRAGFQYPQLGAPCLVVLLGGLGRLVALARLGLDGSRVPAVTAAELLLPLLLLGWYAYTAAASAGAGSVQHPAGPAAQPRPPAR